MNIPGSKYEHFIDYSSMFIVRSHLQRILRSPMSRFAPHLSQSYRHRLLSTMKVIMPELTDEELYGDRVCMSDTSDGVKYEEEPHMPLYDHGGAGYFPLRIGQLIHEGKFEVVRKLGWGAFGSVWLARVPSSKYGSRYVAVKALTVRSTALIIHGFSLEADSLKLIRQTNRRHPGYKHCLQMYDVFVEKGSHGPHVCFVTNVLGCSLDHLRQVHHGESGVFKLPFVKRVVKQVLLAFDYMHRECKIIHADLKPNNILVSLSQADEKIDRYIEQSPVETYEPRIIPELSSDPIITVKSQPLPAFNEHADCTDLNICVADFGNSESIDEDNIESVQPGLLRAPEVILRHPWSTPIDIWSLGCLIFDLTTGDALFQLHPEAGLSMEDVHVARILEHVGFFPGEFLAACTRRDKFF